MKSSPKNTIVVPSRENILFTSGIFIFLSFFKNSTGPASETFLPGKNFKVSGFGVCSVCTTIIT
jgi:hypothetical protein